MPLYLNQKDYAEHRGCHPSRISRLLRAGKLAGATKKISGKIMIDKEKADELLKQNLDQTAVKAAQKVKENKKKNPNYKPKENKNSVSVPEMKQKVRTAGTGKLTLAEAQTIQAQYKAALLKLEYEEKNKELVKVEEIKKDFFNIARLVRDAILNIPDRISGELASITNVHTVQDRLKDELTQALEELAANES